MKKKIVHIQLLPLLSGAQRVTLDELQRLPDAEYNKYIICSNYGSLTDEAQKLGITCIIIKSLVRNISPKKDLIALFNLIKIIKKEKFDIIHTHSSKTGVLGRLAGYITKTPLIIHTVHGFSFPAAKNKLQYYLYYIMERLGTMCGHKLICLHDLDKNIAIEKLKQQPTDIYVIPNGVDIKYYTPPSPNEKSSIRKHLKLTDDDIVIGMIGRLWEQKNPLYLLENMLAILKSNSKIKILFIGDGELFNKLSDLIKVNKLENQIYLLGWRSDTHNILKSIDIFSLPSKWEGMPLAILEAQSTALPCLVSNIPGNNNLVTNNVDGFLFNLNESTNEFKNKINLLINDKELRGIFGYNARSKIEKYYSIDDRIKKIEKIYRDHV